MAGLLTWPRSTRQYVRGSIPVRLAISFCVYRAAWRRWRCRVRFPLNNDWLELGRRAGYDTLVIAELEERRDELLAHVDLSGWIPGPPGVGTWPVR